MNRRWCEAPVAWSEVTASEQGRSRMFVSGYCYKHCSRTVGCRPENIEEVNSARRFTTVTKHSSLDIQHTLRKGFHWTRLLSDSTRTTE